MFKSFLKFAVIVAVCQMLTYFVAGVIAQAVLGAGEFYPPSPHGLSYLRDPHEIPMLTILSAQALRGILFALVLFPFRTKILELGRWYGALAMAGIILIVGYVASSGGLIEHFVFFTAADYPAKFAAITLVEVLIQTTGLGVLVLWLEQRFVKQSVAVPVHAA